MFYRLQEIKLYSDFKLKEFVRINKLKIVISLFILAAMSFGYGIIIAAIFEKGISTFFQSTPNSPTNINLSIPDYFLGRDLLANGILLVYLIYLTNILLKSATGLSNPFVANLYDVNFQFLIPVNPTTAYFSCKITNFIKNIVMVSIVVVGFFYPLLFILKIQVIRLLPLIVNYELGIELASMIGDVLFFLSNNIRAGNNWAIIYTEKNNLFVLGSSFIIPILYFQLFANNLAPTYQTLTNYFYLPFITVAVSNTSLLFRSGIPLVSIMGTLILIIQILFLLVINTVFVKFSSSVGELGDLLPVLEYLDTQKQNLLRNSEEYFINPAYDKVDKNREFTHSKLATIVEKEWLLFRRSNDLKMNLLFILSGSFAILMIILFPSIKQSNNISIVGFIVLYLLIFEIDTIVKIFHSINLNSQLLNVGNKENIKVKIIVSISCLLPIEIIFIGTLNILVLIALIIIGLTADLINRYNARNLFIISIAALLISPLLTFMLV